MQTNERLAGMELKSELARYCLPEVRRDANRKLAWTNSICLLFLAVGLVGAKTPHVKINTPPPMEEIIPAMIEPPPPQPPLKLEAQTTPETNPEQKAVAAPVVVTVDTPAINFSVPTVGSLVVPNSIAVAPPANLNQPQVVQQNVIQSLSDTGSEGMRRQPPYPLMAEQLHQQGTVVLRMKADEKGFITEINVEQSSGFGILDRSTLEYVKKHWILPAGQPGQVYEAPIRFVLK